MRKLSNVEARRLTDMDYYGDEIESPQELDELEEYEYGSEDEYWNDMANEEMRMYKLVDKRTGKVFYTYW